MFISTSTRAKQAIISFAASTALLFLPALAEASNIPPSAIVAQATGANHSPEAMEHHREHWMLTLKKLNLSDAQMGRIKALEASFHSAHPEGSTPDRQAIKAHRKAMMAILTPTQRENLRRMMKAEKHHPGDAGDGH